MTSEEFSFTGERFADLQLLRYQVKGFERLSLRQKLLLYCLSKATLYGRDITFDQQGKYNLRIRKLLESVLAEPSAKQNVREYQALETYLKRVWFSNGIYHHYGCEKFMPEFDKDWFCGLCQRMTPPQQDWEELIPVMFNPDLLPKRVNKQDGEDLILTSACHFYEGVTQTEVEAYYARQKEAFEQSGVGDKNEPPSFGLNTTLTKNENGELEELTWKIGGRYGEALRQIVCWLNKAKDYAESEQQRKVIQLLVDYYQSGDLKDFDRYSIEWVKTHDGDIDFINGFIEVYGDPLGIKATWEGIVEVKDEEATKRTRTISSNAQWFEDNSPVDPRFKKPVVKGVSANAVEAAMLGGEEYPSTAIGINLPNADWIRAEYGSKSVTISNLTHAYSQAAKGNGFREEFVIDKETIDIIDRYGDLCDDLHTDLHECLGHGSGRLLDGVAPDALKAYGNTIEEARADLFGLYYIADEKLVELGLLPDGDAYRSNYYTYLMNGLLTQLVRIKPGHMIEEAHMRNRSLIAHWVLAHADGAVELVRRDGKTFVRVNDYVALRQLFATLLKEVQRIKSEGDYEAARQLVENYGVQVDGQLHQEVLSRYEALNIAPYKGFLNPRMIVETDKDGQPMDVRLDYSETYSEQMLRYSRDYATLI